MRLYPHARHAFQAGYTMLEMAIVIVITGLVAGGIVMGYDMIHGANIRAVINEREQIVSAVGAFHQKYLAFPGDMRNATTYWGAANATPATCQTTASSDALTCNGNSNHKIGDTAATYYECFRFWQHLANAEFIKGTFNGVAGAGGTLHHVAGQNTLASAVKGMMWEARYYDNSAGTDTTVWAKNFKNALAISGTSSTADPFTAEGFTPLEVRSVDDKLDDGLSSEGNVATGNWGACSDGAASNDDFGTGYNAIDNNRSCSIIFLNQF